MKFSPLNFRRGSLVLALAALPLLAGVAFGGPETAPGKQAPQNTSPPSVSGNAVAGSSLSADTGSWSGPGVKVALQWQRCDALGGACADVAGATGTTLAVSDVGSRFRVQVTATNKNGQASATSGFSDLVAAPPAPAPTSAVAPLATSAPTISGAAVQGQQLSAAAGTWSGTQPIAFAYQWHRCNSSGSSCAAISGATTQTYSLLSADVGSAMRVVVTGSNSTGSTAVTSAPTGVVASSTSPSPPAGCSAANPSACPASFFNGPLGANNLIPQKPGAFLIQWYDGIGETTQSKIAGIQKRQSDSGRTMDGVGLHPNWGSPSSGCTLRLSDETSYISWMNSNGSFPVLSWSPDATIGDVNRGIVDACYRNVAAFLKSFPFRIMLRTFWEFDGNWFMWSGMPGAANGNVNYCGQPFIDAWRRMVNIFKQQGASNVGFFWNPGEGGLDRSCSVRSYPGDAYVDWVGTEAYNFCFVGETSCWVTPLHSGWGEFWELANYTGVGGYCGSEPVNAPTCVSQYDKFAGGVYARKPMVTGETGVVYDPNNPSRKGAWYTNLLRAVKGELGPKAMPGVVGIQFYDADVTAAEGPRANFRVDYPTSNASVYNGWLALARDPYFNTR